MAVGVPAPTSDMTGDANLNCNLLEDASLEALQFDTFKAETSISNAVSISCRYIMAACMLLFY